MARKRTIVLIFVKRTSSVSCFRHEPVKVRAMKVFYCDKMVAFAGGDSPSPKKPVLVVEAWRKVGIPLDVEEPEPVTVDDFALAHERAFVERVLELRALNGFGNMNAEVAASLLYTTGSMLAAAQWAIRNQSAAAAPCSGFHHAEWDRAMMFCTFNALMVTACKLRKANPAARVGILDCDHHFGNGTVDIIRKLDAESWVPHVTATRGYQRDGTFLARLSEIVGSFSGCDILLYQAGADPHIDDPYGGFLTTEELAVRDAIVFSECRKMGLPIAWNLAGGYQDDIGKVIEVHVNTALACEREFGGE
jgi:acetoin utilization deacetylase AcuC-like enzyme